MHQELSAALRAALAAAGLLALDVDGTLTDGRILHANSAWVGILEAAGR